MDNNKLQELYNKLSSNSNHNVLHDLTANELIFLLPIDQIKHSLNVAMLAKGLSIADPRPLFGHIWSEGEVGMLFSDTGQCKTVLSVQIANGISKGEDILGLPTTKNTVLFIDCELTCKSFQRRYTDENNVTYNFDDNLIRAELNLENVPLTTKSIDSLIIKSIIEIIVKRNARVIIIDNISFLSESNEKAKEANLLMKAFLNLSRTGSLAILIIAHTPKREFYKALRIEDMAGSKSLANFCDVTFCIGGSLKSPKTKYIKELKSRNTPVEFHDDNVIECEIDKSDGCLKLKYIGLSAEKDHVLNTGLVNAQDEEDIFIKVAKRNNMSNVEIAKILGKSEKTIRNRLNKTE